MRLAILLSWDRQKRPEHPKNPSQTTPAHLSAHPEDILAAFGLHLTHTHTPTVPPPTAHIDLPVDLG